MSDFVQFTATDPLVEPAKEAITYDKYWLSNFRIMAGDSTKPVRLVAVFVPARDVTAEVPRKDADGNIVTDTDGNPIMDTITYKETKPNAQPKRLIIEDLLTNAAADPTGLGTVLNNVMTYLKDRAVAEGIL